MKATILIEAEFPEQQLAVDLLCREMVDRITVWLRDSNPSFLIKKVMFKSDDIDLALRFNLN